MEITRINSPDEIEVCEQVGKGGFGIVYRGLVKSNNQEIAIKQIDLESNETDLMEINKEIQIISECRLPQITKFMGCFVKNYKLWVIMEFVNGGSLYEMLQPGPVTNESTISYIAQEILVALEYLHNQGKIHRDLKSQNILLSSKGEIKLTDFGVSAQLSSNFSRRNTTVGTPYWMAPEVILNDNGGHNNKADIWSLGCCLFEIFTGKPPLQKQYPPMKALRYISRCVKNQDFLELIKLDELDISPGFKDFLKSCFIIDPKLRVSAKSLLNHKFITKNRRETEQIKAVKKLITNKHLWDQENHVLKSHKFYLPTEIIENQRVWNGDGEGEEEGVKFDISAIYPEEEGLGSPGSSPIGSPGVSPPITNISSPAKGPGVSPPITNTSSPAKGSPPSTNPPPINYQSLSNQDTKQKNLAKTVKPELNKILNKVFHKLETKNQLSTEQYDLLVSLNSDMLNLVSFSSSKLLICQYLKYFIKELNKNDNEARGMLKKMILPSEFKDDTIKEVRKKSVFDEIESSLFETWIGEMSSSLFSSETKGKVPERNEGKGRSE